MRLDIGAPLSAAGYISFVIAGGTIISSLFSNRLIHRLKTGKVMIISVTMTAVALLGFSYSASMVTVILWAIPLGLGAGSVDAALNNFVALHYKARHMNWLHCFWGIGATLGPIVLSVFIGAEASQRAWANGYRAIAVFQFVLVFTLLFSLPLWKRVELLKINTHGQEEKDQTIITNRQALGRPGILYALSAFFCYCGYEAAVGIWAASFLVTQRQISTAAAAGWASLFFAGITIGRFMSGIASMRFKPTFLIRLGCLVNLSGVIFIILPLPSICSMFSLILIGLGSAPFYPSMIHETPKRFGNEYSQAAMGLQMACAYIGSTLIPPLIGLLSGYFTLIIWPYAILILGIGALVFSEKSNLNRGIHKDKIEREIT